MASFSITEDFIASLAKTINEAQIPCVLWGHCLLRVHGVPTIVGSIDFVVPDQKLSDAAKALLPHQHLTPCVEGEECDVICPSRPTPAPARHLHIQGLEEPVGLYPQSETLWFLPPLETSLISPVQSQLPPYYILASDKKVLPPSRAGRGSGFYQTTKHPVVAVPSHILLEASLRFHARYSGKPGGGYSLANVCYVGLYIVEDGLLDLQQVPEPLATLYTEFLEGKKPVRLWTMELKRTLGEV